MRRLIASLCILSLIITAPPTGVVRAQDGPCWQCAPALIQGVQVNSGSYKMCVQPGAMTQRIGAIQAGVNYWADHFNSKGMPLSVTVEEKDPESADCNMKVYGDPDLPAAGEAVGSDTGQGARMTLKNSSAYLDRDDSYWMELAAHEFGHILGYAPNNVDGCRGQTIMSNEWLWNSGTPFNPATAMCGDVAFTLWKYGEPGGGYEDSYPAEAEDMWECWDYYWVESWYYRTSSGWVYGGSYYYYLGTHCEPLEAEG